MSYDKIKPEPQSYSYAEIRQVLTAVTSGRKEDRAPFPMYTKYTQNNGGPSNEPIIIMGKNDEPPRLRQDVADAAILAVNQNTRGGPNAKELLELVNQLNEGRIQNSPEVERSNVMAVLTAKKGETPLGPDAYNEVRELLNRKAGGLTPKGLDKYGKDSAIMKAAREQRQNWTPTIKAAAEKADEKATDTVVAKADDILKLLNAGPGEKPITEYKTYRAIVGEPGKPKIVDVYEKGGLTPAAESAFRAAAEKGDTKAQAILTAADKHRAAFVKPPEKPLVTAENKDLLIAYLNRRDSSEKPLTDQQFAELRHMFRPYGAGLTNKAIETAKPFPDVIEANTRAVQYRQEISAQRFEAKDSPTQESNAPAAAALTR